jgi:hypothetical protein
MSDTSILPTADIGAPPAAPVGPDFGEEPTDDRRRLMVIGGVIALVLVVIVGYLVLKGGGSSDSGDLGVVARGTPHSVASPEASAKPESGSGHKAGSLLPKKSHRGIARDPFKPLLSDGTGAAAAAGAGETTDVAPAAGAEPGAAPSSPAEGGAPSASLGTPVAIRLLSVSGVKSALFSVTYSRHKTLRYNVAAPAAGSDQGTVFAGVFSLLGVQGGAVTVQFGDDTPFDLRRGVSRSV